MAHRNAERVLPDPVGARISAWSPPAMAGHPCAWAGVGAGNEVSNHARTAGENGARGSGATTPPRYRRATTATAGAGRIPGAQLRQQAACTT